jgi:hypothetical protein
MVSGEYQNVVNKDDAQMLSVRRVESIYEWLITLYYVYKYINFIKISTSKNIFLR